MAEFEEEEGGEWEPPEVPHLKACEVLAEHYGGADACEAVLLLSTPGGALARASLRGHLPEEAAGEPPYAVLEARGPGGHGWAEVWSLPPWAVKCPFWHGEGYPDPSLEWFMEDLEALLSVASKALPTWSQ